MVIVGGGLCGLVCALRLAEAGQRPTLLEAAPEPGGRTRSFRDTVAGEWMDNGPHLLVGAYRRTRSLLDELGAVDTHWQNTLMLPLWDKSRGHFRFAPPAWLPLAAGAMLQAARLPGHGAASVAGMARLGWAMRRPVAPEVRVGTWLDALRLPEALVDDLLAPLCLGAMNETPDTANAAGFARVLRESFAGHDQARLGWFTRPLNQALIAPLVRRVDRLGARLVTRARVRALSDLDEADIVVLALPAPARNRLLGVAAPVETRAIANLHLWFRDMPPLPAPPDAPFIGVGGRWLFDVSAQMRQGAPHGDDHLRHVCLVESADAGGASMQARVREACRLLAVVCDNPVFRRVPPVHARLVREVHATTQVRQYPEVHLPERIVDASELPRPGGLPATIEFAVRRGEEAARRCLECFAA